MKCPPEFASPYIPVNGDFAITSSLPAVGNTVPVSGPVAKMRRFSGPSGSTSEPTSSQRIFVPKPFPPRKSLAISSGSGEEFGAIVDSIGICKFGTFFPPALYWEHLAKAVSLITGMNLDVAGLKQVGERTVNLQRMYNVRHGITRKDDNQPQRLLKEKSPSGRAKGHVVYLDKMLDEYYELRQWDKATGLPTEQRLKNLGLEYTVDELRNAHARLK